jgi:hypothetical protein
VTLEVSFDLKVRDEAWFDASGSAWGARVNLACLARIETFKVKLQQDRNSVFCKAESQHFPAKWME